MKKRKILALILCMLLVGMFTGCGKSNSEADKSAATERSDKKYITVGFSQIGAESDWRSANTESMKSVFTESNGFRLIFEDAQQKQTNQIMAIRSFIQQEVDYIVLAPVMETGWETVLGEVKQANIPVIIVDRMVDVADDSLYTCFVGSDFELEAKKACAWLDAYTSLSRIAPEDIHIVDIQGTLGASAQIGRTKGLQDACKEKGWDLVAVENGEFTQTKGREVTEELLKKYPEVNVVYCENDNEALGAIEAIEELGYKAGTNLSAGEILVMSFDGVNKEALQDAVDGKIACIAECNPLHGPRVEAIIDKLENGMEPDKWSYVDEEFFSSEDRISSLMAGGKVYPVTILSKIDFTSEEEE